jgi:DNA replication protein DnaC
LVDLFEALAEAEAREAEERAYERGVAEALRHGLGRRSLAIATEAPVPTVALSTAQAWWGGSAWALCLHGSVGQGKTVAAAWVLAQAIRAGRGAQYRPAGVVARLSDFDDGPRELDALKRASVLVLDDVGVEAASERGRAILGEVLDARYERLGTRTVLTSNLGPEALLRRLGQRAWDRLQHDGELLELVGESLRKGGGLA